MSDDRSRISQEIDLKFANMEKNEVITLEDRGFIHASGAEAKDFLQNIYTCDTIYVYVLMYQGKMQNEKKHSFIGGEKKNT